jgi:hypothetical protein
MIGEVAGHRQLLAVQSAIPQAVDAFIGVDLEGYKISSGRTDKDFGILNPHPPSSLSPVNASISWYEMNPKS